MIKKLTIHVARQGLHGFAIHIDEVIAQSGFTEGLCTLLIQHTFASRLIQENYDPSARLDLENWLNRLLPENVPSTPTPLKVLTTWHIKAALTASQPVNTDTLALGQ
ncbi:MAG: secondary thiamine-phosphate synthase enzyme [Litorivivens sp.]|jgi:secondary thiamine-phosphate synthase enzyme